MGDSNIKNGNIYPTKRFGNVEVIEYLDKYNITIMFLNTSSIVNVTASALRGGECVDNNVPTFLDIGYLGYGKYSTRSICGKSKSRAYEYWSRMLKRCYCSHSKDYKHYGAKGVTVCEEWHNFQNFAEWFYNQPNCNKSGYHLDKDLTIVGNKVYRPEACEMIPACINTMQMFRSSVKFGVTSSGKWRYTSFITKKPSRSFTLKEECEKEYMKEKKNTMTEILTTQYTLGNISEKFYLNTLSIIDQYLTEGETN